ncbi:MAG TPA: sulfotransferase [Longimicrobiales bacterium]|nr:sulfotransferase [Longimicrobiales bacterium]
MLRSRLASSGGAAHGRRMRARLWGLRFAATRLSSSVEERLFGDTIRSTPLEKPPLFIVGHYRSGSTLLHKLIAADPQIASVDTYDLLFPTSPRVLKRVTRPLLQAGLRLLRVRQSFFHDYVVRLDDPNELEPLMLSLGSPWSAYWGYFCPNEAERHLHGSFDTGTGSEWRSAYAYFVRRTAWKTGGPRLVIKDPMNTGRLGELVEMFPGARFVHIHRDPRRVVESMWRLWRDTIEPEFSLQRITDERRARIILEHYRTLMSRYERQRTSVPGDALVELRYDDLRADPIGAVKRLYTELDVPGFADAEPYIARRLTEDAGYTESPREASTPVLAALTESVEEWCGRLGYAC